MGINSGSKVSIPEGRTWSKLAHVQMTSIGAVNQSIPNQGMEECSIDTHVASSISVAFVHDAYNGLRFIR